MDGDSMRVRTSDGRVLEVRLSTIDAPERRQPFANVSRRHLDRLLDGRDLSLDVRDTDRYGRIVAVVRVDGRDAGLEMLRAGLAWHYDAYAQAQPRDEEVSYRRAEERARNERSGLWRDTNPLPPWEFRRRARR